MRTMMYNMLSYFKTLNVGPALTPPSLALYLPPPPPNALPYIAIITGLKTTEFPII